MNTDIFLWFLLGLSVLLVFLKIDKRVWYVMDFAAIAFLIGPMVYYANSYHTVTTSNTPFGYILINMIDLIAIALSVICLSVFALYKDRKNEKKS